MPETMLIQSVITDLPLPLAQTLRRAVNAKSPQEQHNGAYYFFESALKFAAAAQIGVYTALGCPHGPLNTLLENLARPSVGHWLALLRETSAWLASRPDAALLPLGNVHERLTQRKPLPAAAAFIAFAARAANVHDGRQSFSVLDLLDAVVAYRNHELGHGAQRERGFYAEAAPLLIDATLESLRTLRPADAMQLVVTRDLVDVRTQKATRRFDVLRGDGLHVPMEAGQPNDAAIETGRLLLAAGAQRVSLHPLLVYEIDGLDRDRIGFLNHVAERGRGAGRAPKRVEYLDYDSGDRLDGHDALAELAALFSRVRGQEVLPRAIEQLSQGGTELLAHDAPADTRQFIGDFELLEELGRGGMGIVYKARQRSLGRIVALKVLPPAMAADVVSVARFKREIAALGRCDHPNVVKVLTAGQDGERYYYAMEYVEGSDLSQVAAVLGAWRSVGAPTPMREGHIVAAVGHSRQTRTLSAAPQADSSRLPAMPKAAPQSPQIEGGRDYFVRLAEIMGDAASGVQHLHEHGIIHRDLKPANIMLTADGRRAVIMDLGLAQLEDRTLSLTASSVRVIGTLRYLPPEQLQHNLLSVTPRADIYSLGATLYELAALSPMFDGDTEARLMQQVLQEEPKAPSRLNAAVPRDLETIITVATAKLPGERYATAQALAADLGAFSRGEPISARPPSAFHYLKLFYRRNRALAHGAALALTLLLALATWFVARLEEERTEAQRQAAIASRNEKTATAEAGRANRAEQTAKAEAEEAEKQRGIAVEKTREVAQALKQAGRNLALAHLEKAATARADGRFQAAAAHAAAAWDADNESNDPVSLASALDRGRGPVWKSGTAFDGCTGTFDLRGDCQVAIGPCGTEGRLWDVGTGATLATLGGHKEAVSQAVISKDGRFALTAEANTALLVWNVERREVLHRFGGLASQVSACAISPDGRFAACALRDGTVHLWSVTGGAKLRGWTLRDGAPRIAFSQDGKRLAAAGSGGMLAIMDVESGSMAGDCVTGLRNITALAFWPGGTRIACADFSGALEVWDLGAAAPLLAEKQGHSQAIYALAFAPDGKSLLTGGWDKALKLWGLEGNTGARLVATTTDGIRSAAFAADGRQVLVGTLTDRLMILDLQSGARLTETNCHQGSILCAAVSPDGRVIVTGSQDGTARLWDSVGGRCVRALRGHTDWVRAAAVTPDNRYALTAGYDATCRLWELATGVEAAVFSGHSEAVLCAAISPDGTLALTGGKDEKLLLWELRTRRVVKTLTGHLGYVLGVAFSPDGKRAVSGGVDKALLVWDIEDPARLTPVQRLEGEHKDGIRCVAFSPDGQFLLSGSSDNTARLWDRNGQCLRTFNGHSARVDSVAFSPDSQFVVSGSEDCTVRLWDVRTGATLTTLEGHEENVGSVAFSPDGRYVVSAGWDRVVCVWEVEPGKSLRTFTGHAGLIYSTALSPDGRIAISGDQSGQLLVWDVKSRALMAALPAHKGALRALAFSSSGRWVASAGNDHHALLWDFADPKHPLLVRSFEGHKGAVTDVAISTDETQVLTGGEDREIRLWSVQGERVTVQTAGDWIYRVAFNNDGTLALAACGDRSLLRWNLARNSVEQKKMVQSARVQSIAFSHDGSRALAGTIDGSLLLWDIESDSLLLELKGHRGRVLGVSLSPDGNSAASAGRDHSLRLWDLKTGLARVVYEGHSGPIQCLACDAAWQSVITGSADGTLRLWDAAGRADLAPAHSSELAGAMTALRMVGMLPRPTAAPLAPLVWLTPDRLPPSGLCTNAPAAQPATLDAATERWLERWREARLRALREALTLFSAAWNDQFEGYRYREERREDGSVRRVSVAVRAKTGEGRYVGEPEGFVDYQRWWHARK